MANKKITYTLELDAEIKDLESKLNKTKSSLDSIFKSGQAPAGLEKAFERLGELFDRIKDKAKSPLDSKSGFTSIGKDVDSVNQSLNALSRILSEIASKGTDNFALLPKDTQAQITAIVKSIEDYGAAVQASTIETKELVAAREALAKATTKVQDAQANVNTKSTLFEQAKQERDALQAQIDVIKERQKALKEAKIEQAKVDSFYSKPDEDGKPRDKRRKYEGISSTPAQAKAKTNALIAASEGDDAELASLTEQLKRAKKDIESYNTQLGTANRTLREANTAADSAQESFDRLNEAFQSGSEQKKQKAFDELKQKAEELGIEISDIGDAFSQEDANTLIKRLNSVSDKAFEKFADNAKEAADAVEDLGESTKKVKDKLEDGTEALQNMTDAANQRQAFEEKIKQFLGLSGAAQVLRSALRDAMATITELDATMTEMAVVTDLTVGDYWDQLPEYSKQASELGVSINSAYKAATLYYQQGLKGNEVTKISAETLKLAKIAGIDAADATNKMTAALRGFNMELNEASAQKVADVYAELAAITAADVDEISNAMTKTASIASSAGMEFETTAAFLSQIIETTRESAETAGTALKTVIARFQELKKDPSEIGEVDGEIVDANKIETALRTVGVALRDSNGQFRDLDDVFMDLSQKWDGLDKNTQRYIATIAAGSRQQSRFIAMMSDYGRTQELVSAANNSAGASNKQFEKTMDSLEAKVEKLKNAWHEFTMGIANSDLIKFGVDILTKFLEIVNKATSAIDGLGGSLTKIASVLAIFKLGSAIFAKFKQPIINLFGEIVKLAGISGEESAKEFKQGVERGKQNDAEAQLKTSQEKTTAEKIAEIRAEKEQQARENMTKKDKAFGVVDKVGGGHFSQASDKFKQGKQAKKYLEVTAKNGVTKDTLKGRVATRQNELAAAMQGGDDKAIKDAQKNLQNAEKQLETYNKKTLDAKNASKEAWKEVGAGIGAAGQAIAGAGVAVSMLGGLLQTLGFEEAGEVIAGIGQGITMVGTALMAIPPILTLITAHPIIAIITAVLGLIIALSVACYNAWKKNQLDEKMKRAAEATEGAKKAAEAASNAYEEMLSHNDKYKETQQALKDLTYGTNEWKEALFEANQQVLDLVTKYPELAAYMTRGAEGQLTISDAGWDQMIQTQQEKVKTANMNVVMSQMEEQRLKVEQANQEFTKASTLTREDSEGNYDKAASEKATADLQEALTDLYFVQGSSLDEQTGKVEELAQQYGFTTAEIWKAADALEKNRDNMEAIAFQAEQVARAGLTSVASSNILDDDLGDEVVDAFASSMSQDKIDEEVEKRMASMEGTSDWRDNEQFKGLAEEYGVEQGMTGDDLHDLQLLYKEMAGLEKIEDIPDEFKENEEALLKEIAKMDVAKDFNEKMEKYMTTLQDIREKERKGEIEAGTAQRAAAMLSSGGSSMTGDEARAMFKDGEFDQEKVKELATSLGYESVDAYAEALGMSVEELYDEIEENSRAAMNRQQKTFNRLNNVLGTGEQRIENFGDNIRLDTETENALGEKLVDVANSSGSDAAISLNETMRTALESMGENADEVAAYLGSMDWTDLSSWDDLEEYMVQSGFTMTDSMKSFVAQAQRAAQAVKKVDLNRLSSDLASIYDVMNKLKAGEQNREFDQDTYDTLIASNKDLAKQFTQVGDKYVYLGSSMSNLTDALSTNTYALQGQAKKQLDSKIILAQTYQNFENPGNNQKGGITSILGSTLSLKEQDYTKWSDIEKQDYLDTFRDSLVQGIEERTVSADVFQALGISGFSAATDFSSYDSTKLDEMLQAIKENGESYENLTEEQTKLLRDINIGIYAQDNVSANIAAVRAGRKVTGETATMTKEAQERAAALSVQAATSGVITEAILAEYNTLLAKAESGTLSSEEAARMTSLESTMSVGLERIAKNQEGISALTNIQTRVAEAIYNSRQKEIDALNEVNESIQSTNGNLINKIQEQIDEERQQRQNEKTEKNIADLRQQQMLLGMDTSGANALAMNQLDQQIMEAEQDFTDTLIDQAIQDLNDANEKAAEQRQQQIDLLQSQLNADMDSGVIMAEAVAMTNEYLNQLNDGYDILSTPLWALLYNSENLGALSEESLDAEISGLAAESVQAANTIKAIDDGAKKGAQATEDQNKDLTEGSQSMESQILAAIKKTGAKEETRESAVEEAANALTSSSGWTSRDNVKEYAEAKAKYISNGGRAEDFDTLVDSRAGGKDKVNKEVTSLGTADQGWWAWEDVITSDGFKDNVAEEGGVTMKKDGKGIWVKIKGFSDEARKAAVAAGEAKNNNLFKYKGDYYIYKTDNGGVAFKVVGGTNWTELQGYETGGLADFTGPAWLDGTKSRPEYVLNADQTERFFSLVDVLEGFDNRSETSEKSGDNYFDIQINVDKLENDYDVEQMANKIRRMIYEDATYRNVNSINLIR